MVTGCHPKQKAGNGMIALTPSLADAVSAFEGSGALDAYPLVAVSKFADHKRYKHIRKLDSSGALETIAELRPALVLLHSSDTILAEKLKHLGIRIIMHDMDTVDDIMATVTDIGRFLNQEKYAEQIRMQLEQTLENNRHKYRDTRASIPSALIIVDRLDMRMQQLYIAQKPAYLIDLFEGCGIDSIQMATNTWARIDAETLIHQNPQMIIFLARDRRDGEAIKSAFEEIYADLDAVKKQMLYIYSDSDITVPGPDIGDKQEILCKDLQAFLDNRKRND